MSATIQLNESTATIGATLAFNTEYNLIVTTANGTASKVFSIPATAEGVTVMGYDASKRTIEVLPIVGTAAAGYAWANALEKYQFAESETVDYANLLGETVTFKFDTSNQISNLKKLTNERVIYGAFKIVGTSAKDVALQDIATEEKYYPQDDFSGVIPTTLFDDYEGAATLEDDWDSTEMAKLITNPATQYAYGKVVLNVNGTIKCFWKLTQWSGNIYVKEVSGNSIISKTNQEQSLEKYTILKDGKSIAIADIVADDVVFFNTTVKMAEVFNNVQTGELQAVYDNAGFKFADKNRDGSKASYIDGTSAKTVDTNYLKALKAAGKDITVIFNRANEVLYVLGEQGTVVTSSYDLVLTAKGDGYAGTTSGIIALKGFNGTEEVSKNINVSDIQTLKVAGKTFSKTTGKFYTTDTKTKKDWGTANTGEGLGFDGNATDGTAVTAITWGSKAGNRTVNDLLILDADMPVGTVVNLTENDKNVVTAIEVKSGTALVPGDDKVQFDGKNEKDFKAGYKTVQADKSAATKVLTLPASANVYVLSKSGTAISVEKCAYSDFDKVVANAKVNNIRIFSSETTITDVVIDNTEGAAFSEDETGSTVVEGVVQEMHLLSGEVSDIIVVTKDGEKTYSKFGSDKSKLKTSFAQGTIVDLTVLKDGETVTAVVADGENTSDTYTNAIYGVTTTAPGSAYIQAITDTAAILSKVDFTSDALLVKVENDKVSTISLSDLKSGALKNEVVLSTVTKSNDKVDTAVLTKTARAANGTIASNTVTTGWQQAVEGLDIALQQTTIYGVSGVTAVESGSGVVTDISTANQYTVSKNALRDLGILLADIEAADGTGTTNKTAAWTGKDAETLYTSLNKAEADCATVAVGKKSVAWAAKHVIISTAPVTTALTPIAISGAITADQVNKMLSELESSLGVTFVDGSQSTITIAKPTNKNNTSLNAADKTGWYWDDTTPFDATTNPCTFTLTNDKYVLPAVITHTVAIS